MKYWVLALLMGLDFAEQLDLGLAAEWRLGDTVLKAGDWRAGGQAGPRHRCPVSLPTSTYLRNVFKCLLFL